MKKDMIMDAVEKSKREGVVPVLIRYGDSICQFNMTKEQIDLLNWLDDNDLLIDGFTYIQFGEIPIEYDVTERDVDNV